MTNINKPVEPTWVYPGEIEKLRKKTVQLEQDINRSFEEQKSIFLNVVSGIKEDVKKITLDSINESKVIHNNLSYKISDIERNLIQRMDSLDLEHNLKNNQIYNTLNAYKKQVETIHFDIIDNDDNIAINYVNPNGKLEYGYIKKIIPDNKTLKLNNFNQLELKYNFKPQTFKINKNNNDLSVVGLELENGKFLDADRIFNDLNNASYNISSLTYKLENALHKLNNINGYLASNNFKKASPNPENITNFALECISTGDKKATIDSIPAGTKIKNTYDNHIWVFNKLTYEGLTTYKWEDFGADNICIASNDGVHGLVTGSHDHFKAFVDINGTISINGLEEDFQNIIQSLSELSTQIKDIQSNYEYKILNIESRLNILEGKNA